MKYTNNVVYIAGPIYCNLFSNLKRRCKAVVYFLTPILTLWKTTSPVVSLGKTRETLAGGWVELERDKPNSGERGE